MVTDVLEFPLPAPDRPVRAASGTEAYAGSVRPASDALVHQLAEALLTEVALLGADAGVVCVRLADGRLHVAASAGLRAEELAALRARPPAGVTLADVADVGDREGCQFFPTCRSFPITTPGGEHWGAMVLYFRDPRQPSAARVRLAESFVHQLGWAVERDRRAAGGERDRTATGVTPFGDARLGDARAGEAPLADAPVEGQPADVAPARAEAVEAGPPLLRATTERALALQALSDALAGAVSSTELLRLAAERCAATVGAHAAVVVQQPSGGDRLDIVATVGPSATESDVWRGVPAEPLPATEALAGERPVFVGSPDELADRFPALDDWRRRSRTRALAAFPLLVPGEPAAALVLGFPATRRFEPDEREYLEALARVVARALERLHLAQAARAASEAKADFLAMMSHELRTPLNAIMGYTGLLAAEVVGPINDTQREQLHRVQEQAQHLLGLIEEVLTLSRAEAGAERLHLEPVDPGALLRDVVAVLAPAAQRKGLTLETQVEGDLQPTVLDADKVRQVLAHLLTNAVKFTERGGIVASVREERAMAPTATGATPAAPALVFAVHDTGLGIAADHLAHIFEPFWQAERKHARRLAGTGLGLNVTRRLADLLGGDVRVASTPGQGSTFELWLPAARA